MSERHLKTATSKHSLAHEAECALDYIEWELRSVSSTALLLATAEPVDEIAQLAFRGLANSLDAVIDRVKREGERFNALSAGQTVPD